jgi:hypothetical protein
MSTPYDGPSAARIPYSSLDNPRLIARLVVTTVIAAAVVAFAFATRDGTARAPQIPGVTEACDNATCISPRQLVTASDARALKRRLGNHALVVDIGSTTDGAAFGSDVKAPFVESAAPSAMTFRMDFGDKVDDALRAAGMGHDEPVILLAPSPEHSVLAALLLQERGYTAVLVVRD